MQFHKLPYEKFFLYFIEVIPSPILPCFYIITESFFAWILPRMAFHYALNVIKTPAAIFPIHISHPSVGLGCIDNITFHNIESIDMLRIWTSPVSIAQYYWETPLFRNVKPNISIISHFIQSVSKDMKQDEKEKH